MRCVSNRKDMRMRNRPQVGVDPDPVLRIGGKSRALGEVCRPQAARPYAEIKRKCLSAFSHDLGSANLGDRRAIDKLDAKPHQLLTYGGFDAGSLEVAAMGLADHGHVRFWPCRLDFTGDLDRRFV